jgi:hypothetical protein
MLTLSYFGGVKYHSKPTSAILTKPSLAVRKSDQGSLNKQNCRRCSIQRSKIITRVFCHKFLTKSLGVGVGSGIDGLIFQLAASPLVWRWSYRDDLNEA